MLFSVENEEELMCIRQILSKEGIQSKAFYEPDNRMGYSALTTEPIWGEKRKLLRGYTLWREVDIKQ